MCGEQPISPAEVASERALAQLRESIEQCQSFKLEAGAGAGKTYSLIEALKFVVERRGRQMQRRSQRIACITFTNVAKDEIITRTDRNPLIQCDTIHGFCWSIIAAYQSQLRQHLTDLNNWSAGRWAERLEEAGGIGQRTIAYKLGHRGISDEEISLHHDDVLPLTITLLGYEKFRNILAHRYPIILIDEYQDTDADWIASIKATYLDANTGPLFGFFGDHWQKIYGQGCGAIAHDAIREIGKEANFRSVATIVDCLNRMRPELPQFVVDPEVPGEVRVFHTNSYQGQRQAGAHYGGDLPDEEAGQVLAAFKGQLEGDGWDLSADITKILMLTHRALGREQGYASLHSVFRYNEAFAKKEHPHIAFFADRLEPACLAFAQRRYGEVFEALGANKVHMLQAPDKQRWAASMQRLIELREDGNVSDLIEHMRNAGLPRLPESVARLERRFVDWNPDTEEEMPRALRELDALHNVVYQEIIALTQYLDGHSPFETKHGVKGAQFENVLVILGRGWNRYNFSTMLENVPRQGQLNGNDRATFENNRNLFYVACSRPKIRLALLFTQTLSDAALVTLNQWFGDERVQPIEC